VKLSLLDEIKLTAALEALVHAVNLVKDVPGREAELIISKLRALGDALHALNEREKGRLH
jgi:hypothetical protein